jgi:hypothetical protein
MFRKSARTDELGNVHNTYSFTFIEGIKADHIIGACVLSAILAVCGMIYVAQRNSHTENMYELETKRLNPAPISSVK